MKQENFNTNWASEEKPSPVAQPGRRKLRVLVAPLDWGLGHATRCIPVVYELLRQDCEVWLAAEGDQEVLLKQEFPQLTILPLEGYRVKYGRSASRLRWNIIFQSGKIIRGIKEENRWLKKAAIEWAFDGVIADNRYGLYHSSIPSVFITHQLTIKSPFGKWTERFLQKKNYKYINHFTACWVPDLDEKNNLGGELSHPLIKPDIPVYYIGHLSRFNKQGHGDYAHEKSSNQNEHLLFILSGPEPQRSILENKIIKDIAHYGGSATIVRGLPAASTIIPSTNTIKFFNHLSTTELNEQMMMAGYIISRSGYSTIMDIARLEKKSILIPTPGQTEQEYLAKYLHDKKIAFSVAQNSFSLFTVLETAKKFSYTLPEVKDQTSLHDTIARFILTLK